MTVYCDAHTQHPDKKWHLRPGWHWWQLSVFLHFYALFSLFFPDEKMTGDASLRTTDRWHRSSSPLSHCNTPNHYYRLLESFAYNTRWPLHCGGVPCFAASCSFSSAFTVQKVSCHGVTGPRVVLMWFWSTFQEATYYSVYECVEFISTHSSVSINSFSSVVLPLKLERRVSNTYHWESLVTHGHSHWHISSLSEHRSQVVSETFPQRFKTAPFLHCELYNRLNGLWGTEKREADFICS